MWSLSPLYRRMPLSSAVDTCRQNRKSIIRRWTEQIWPQQTTSITMPRNGTLSLYCNKPGNHSYLQSLYSYTLSLNTWSHVNLKPYQITSSICSKFGLGWIPVVWCWPEASSSGHSVAGRSLGPQSWHWPTFHSVVHQTLPGTDTEGDPLAPHRGRCSDSRPTRRVSAE